MASGSPRARIDQFFASRKRKGPPAKGERRDKNPGSPANGSPGAKGTLDGYLVRSPDPGPRPGHREAAAVGREPARRNLSAEIGSVGSDAVPRSRSSENGAASDVGDPAGGGSVEGGGSSELKRFAEGFLSLYCSDIPSSVNPPAENESRGLKRNGSPSLAVSSDKIRAKKQCAVNQNDRHAEIEPNAKLGDGVIVSSAGNNKNIINGLGGQFEKESVVGHVSLRRCKNTPKSSLLKTGLCIPVCHETPKSAFRNSIISPGEEFWNAAIQAADGIFAPDDKFGIKLLEDNSHIAAAAQCSKSFRKSRNDDLDGRTMVASNCVKPIDEPAEETKVSQHENASPLPVKHLDFSQDGENSRNQDLGKDEGGTRAVNSKDNIRRIIFDGKPTASSSDSHLDSCESVSSFEISHQSANAPVSAVCEEEKLITTQRNIRGNKGGLVTLANGTNFKPNNGNLCVGPLNCVPDEHNIGEKVQRRPVSQGQEACTPTSSMRLDDRLKLASWLPPELCNVYMKKGISKLYPWQVECLLVEGVLERRNLVYCASTRVQICCFVYLPHKMILS